MVVVTSSFKRASIVVIRAIQAALNVPVRNAEPFPDTAKLPCGMTKALRHNAKSPCKIAETSCNFAEIICDFSDSFHRVTKPPARLQSRFAMSRSCPVTRQQLFVM
jgi:hypothetical protein